MTTEPINGRSFLRALAYALKAVPTGDENPDLQHVTLIGNRIVGADGQRWHVGYMPEEIGETVSITRMSASDLLLALDYAHRVSKRHSGTFSVTRTKEDIVIEYGAKGPIVHPLGSVDVGSHPEVWAEPVPQDAPLNPGGLGHIECGHLKEAMSWWKSWDKDYGTCEIRGGLDGGPIRADIVAGGDLAATAFVLPADHPPAELRDAMPLFDGLVAGGRSNLELDLSGDGRPTPPPLILRIEVGGAIHELNVTGLPGGQSLLQAGPCDHRDTHEACLPCTEAAIASARLLVEDVPKPKKRRGRKPKAEAVQEDDDFQPMVYDNH